MQDTARVCRDCSWSVGGWDDRVRLERTCRGDRARRNSRDRVSRRRAHRAAADVAKAIHFFRVAIGLPSEGAYLDRYAPSRMLSDDEQRRITVKGISPITVWREHLDISIDDLAARAYTTPAEIVALENGQRPVRDDLIFEVAATLDLPVPELRPGRGSSHPARQSADAP